MDTHAVARERLFAELRQAGLEVVVTAGTRGLVTACFDTPSGETVTLPIQVRAATERIFGVMAKWAEVPNLLIAYMWHVHDPSQTATYALTYAEAVGVAERVWPDFQETHSWTRQDGQAGFGTTNPGELLASLLEPYRMTPLRWWSRVTSQL